jgi:hypothetical protein
VAVVEQSVALLAPVMITVPPGVAVPDTVGVRVVNTSRGLVILMLGAALTLTVGEQVFDASDEVTDSVLVPATPDPL